MAKQSEGGIKIITTNRKAYHDYHVEDTIEAGIVLTGSEVTRQGLGAQFWYAKHYLLPAQAEMRGFTCSSLARYARDALPRLGFCWRINSSSEARPK